ncbi:nuclear pore complex protein NUP1-like [Durio zibethinus]|uniref:Nuclear pore complex protein NUP1-like n=1 Tax=Durio zibethinus TaxID=66656 RepID=A0A6P5XMD3_DURZI|nr:nuclear pore complex protein NUP1-like [Durio zibethinus]
MEKTTKTTPSYSLQDPQATDLAAGRKLRQTPRRPWATPYARPQQNQSLRGRFLSKLVDPACRLIAGGATRVFPSLFSNPLTNVTLPPPEPQTHGNLDEDVEEHSNGEDQTSSIFGVSQTTGTSTTTDGSKAGSDFAENREGSKGDVSDDRLSEIEKLVEGKTFSRDEINHLIGIINSRAADVPKVDQESGDLILSAGGVRGPMVAHNLRRPTEEKQDDLNKAVWDMATPLPKPTVLNETGSSPIEIAKAYMASRIPEGNLGSKIITSKDERPTMLSDDFASEPFVPLLLPKPSSYWPGSMVQDQHRYLTPQSQRGRFGLHNIPRTPYSRTIFSQSKLKLAHVRDEGNGFLNSSFSPLQQSQTPIHGKLRSNIVDDAHGSVGPIRRIRHKVTAETPSRGSVYSHSSLNDPFLVGNSNVSDGLFCSIKKNLEQRGTSSSSVFQSVDGNRISDIGIPPVHPHSSQTARTILEHLERNLATPKEKSNELKIATSRKRSQSSDANVATSKGHNSLPYLGLDSSKSRDQINNRSPTQWNEDRGNSFSVASPESTIEAQDVKRTSASDLKVDSTITMFGNNAGSSVDFGKNQDSQSKNAHKDLSKVTDAATSECLQKPCSNSLGNKPVLASISVKKPEQRWMFTSDNSSGFTFPVPASSGVSSEPPTPSIMPSLSGSSLHQPKEEHTGPSYSFGSNRSSTTLVFSFPSTSSASKHVDASDITFNFGSDRSSRISFSSIGKKYHMLQTQE